MNKTRRGTRVVLLGIVINALLAIIKIAAGIIGTSYALIADGIESTTDIFSSVIVWSGLKIAAIPPDKNHPYGHGKAEALAAMTVSLFLLGAAAFIIYNSIHEIYSPHYSPAPFTLIVLVGVIAVKETLFRTVLKVGSDIESTAVTTDAWHHRSDAITSAAAFVGISVALIMGPGYESADDYGALVASGLIIFNGLKMLKSSLSDIMDESPPELMFIKVIETAMSVDGVCKVNSLKIRKSGLSYLVDMDIQVSGDITVIEGHDISDLVGETLKKSNLSISEVMVHMEPFINMSGPH
ncbi:MAG: cation transporter [Ignavibacteriae bacterium]|nr:MAG: cation transporter [Ignavibacteriota bacterium]